MIYDLSIRSEKKRAEIYFWKLTKEKRVIEFKIVSQKRTDRQNRSIWLYCELLADALNDAGLYLPITFFNKTYQRSWTKESVMEDIWRPMQKGLFNTKSTTKLKTNQVSGIYEEINRALAETYNLYVPFPSWDTNI